MSRQIMVRAFERDGALRSRLEKRKGPPKRPLRPLTNPVFFGGGFLFGVRLGLGSCGLLWGGPQCHRDFLDVLGGCGEEGLGLDLGEGSEAGVAVAEELFGVGE